jgi:hypothetical protein
MRKLLVASLAVIAVAAAAPNAAQAREGAGAKVAGPGSPVARDGGKRLKPVLRVRPVRAAAAVQGYFEG